MLVKRNALTASSILFVPALVLKLKKAEIAEKCRKNNLPVLVDLIIFSAMIATFITRMNPHVSADVYSITYGLHQCLQYIIWFTV